MNVWWCQVHDSVADNGDDQCHISGPLRRGCRLVEMRLDALASQVGEKPICGDSQHRHIGACELYTYQVGESE